MIHYTGTAYDNGDPVVWDPYLRFWRRAVTYDHKTQTHEPCLLDHIRRADQDDTQKSSNIGQGPPLICGSEPVRDVGIVSRWFKDPS